MERLRCCEGSMLLQQVSVLANDRGASEDLHGSVTWLPEESIYIIHNNLYINSRG